MKWKKPTQEETQRGVFNFEGEVYVMRDYLDYLHFKHQEEPSRPIDLPEPVGHQEKIHEKLYEIYKQKTRRSK